MTRLVLAASLLASVSTAALAQPSTTTPEAPRAPVKKTKEPGIAIGLTLGGAVGGLLVGGLIAAASDDDASGSTVLLCGAVAAIGPSAGHMYAGAWGRAALTSTARLFGGALAIEGFADHVNSHGSEEGDAWTEEKMTLGLILLAGATLFDLIGSPIEVSRQNRRNLAIAPTLGTVDGHRVTGLAIGGGF